MVRIFLLVLLVIPMLLLGAEMGVRQSKYRHLVKSEKPVYPNRYFQEHPLLEVDLSINRSEQSLEMRGPIHNVSTNRWGCYDYNRGTGKNYILIVGGDGAWGYVPIVNHWGTGIETELGYRVVKCGVPGTGTSFHLQKAKQVIREIGEPPGLIILFYENDDFIDDLVKPNFMMANGERIERFRWMDLETGYVERHTQESFQEERKQKERPLKGKEKARQFLQKHSALYQTAMYFLLQEKERQRKSKNRIKGLREIDFFKERADLHWLDNELNTHLEKLAEIKALAEWHGSSLMVLTNNLYSKNRGEKVQAWLDNNVQNVFDVGQAVKTIAHRQNKEAYLDFYPYWNSRGNQMASFEIIDYIKSNGVIK